MLIFKRLIKIIKPFRYISLITTYILGAGLVQYVQNMRSWLIFFQGLFFLILTTISFDFLAFLIQINDPRGEFNDLCLKDRKQLRLSSALTSATLLTIAIIIFVDWMVKGILWQGLGFLMLLLGIAGLFYVISIGNEKISLFQILFETVLFVILPPAFAYFLQSEDLHRLLAMVVLSLIPAYIAYRLLSQLLAFDRDPNGGNHHLIKAIGWEQSMFLHNALILLSFFLYAVDALFGFPWFLLWPVFLTLPIGLLEVWLMERVRRGGKPLWRAMRVSTACVYFLPMYLIGFAFWIR